MIKDILVTLNTGEVFVIQIDIPKNAADNITYTNGWLDKNIPNAVEWTYLL